MADQGAWQAPQDEARLGSYRVLAELARGGMAAVFLALREPRQQAMPAELQEIARRGRYDEDALRIARIVEGSTDIAAIKQIHAHLAHDPDFVAMLIDEARIATRIHHPNVVEIRECRLGENDGTNFIVMEYVAGESLSTLLKATMTRGGRFSPAVAASIGADVAGALHTAHELRGDSGEPLELVHRDVSPQNVIVRYDGRVKLTDFGVAKAVGRLQRTQPGEIKGKLAYMAPEQAYGRAVDRRSDVYSLGVVLYEVALGRRLFGGKSDAETVRNIIQHNVPAPRSIDPNFPVSLEEILLGMLQADPSQRFQSAGAVERALRAFVTTAGEVDVDQRLGELARTLDPARYHAKTDLVVKALAASHRHPTPMPPPAAEVPARDPGESRTLVASSRPPRIATQAAPKARSSPHPPPVDPSNDARTIPMADQARAAMAALAAPLTPSPPKQERPSIGEGQGDYTQPTLRRSELAPEPVHTSQRPPAIDATTPSIQAPPPSNVGERTMMAGDPYAQQRTPSMRPPAPNDAAAIQQTMLAELPPQFMQQVAQAAQSVQPPQQQQQQQQQMQSAQGYPYTSQPPHVSQPPHNSQPQIQLPHSQRPLAPPPAQKQGGLWAMVAVGMVLFVLAALFVLWRLA
ncbi:MAG: protein kinase [Polyangiales bacterium]